MSTSAGLVKAFAVAYSEQELRAKITATARDAVENPNMITSASTGGGSSYAREERIKVTDLLELLEAALEYKLTGQVNSGNAQSFDVVVSRTE